MDDESEYFEGNDNRQDSGDNLFWPGLITGIVLASLIWGIGKYGKYEDQTAEEWFNEYDYCESRLQTYQECAEDAIPNIVYYCSP